MNQFPKANVGRRIAAAVIDGVIAAILSSIIPFIGFIFGAAYTLTKDAIIFELLKNNDFLNKSIGKKLMNLEVTLVEGEGRVDWMVSVRRNIPLAIGTIIMIIPVIGWVVGSIVASLLGLIEIIMVLTQADGRRLGDKFGQTQVIDSVPVVASAPQESVDPPTEN